jgi:hypothetical protein
MKRFLIAMLLVLAMTITGNVTEAADKITVKVNGEIINFDTEPYIENNRTMVPIRFISEALGAKVDWDGVYRLVTITLGDTKIEQKIGKTVAIVNGHEISFDVPAVIKNDRTMVPVRFVSEALGADVIWEAETKTVIITTKKETTITPTPILTPIYTPTPTPIKTPINTTNNKEYKELADMIRKVIELERNKEWDKVYEYLLPESLQKKGITNKNGFEAKYEKLSGFYRAFIEMYNLKEYQTKCVFEKVNENKVRVIYGMFGTFSENSNALDYESRYLVKKNGKWYVDIEPVIVKNTERFYYKDGI